MALGVEEKSPYSWIVSESSSILSLRTDPESDLNTDGLRSGLSAVLDFPFDFKLSVAPIAMPFGSHRIEMSMSFGGKPLANQPAQIPRPDYATRTPCQTCTGFCCMAIKLDCFGLVQVVCCRRGKFKSRHFYICQQPPLSGSLKPSCTLNSACYFADLRFTTIIEHHECQSALTEPSDCC